MERKFRSMQAFVDFQQRRLVAPDTTSRSSRAVNPLTVLVALRKHPDGATPETLAGELRAEPAPLAAALSELLREELIQLEPGDAGEVVRLR